MEEALRLYRITAYSEWEVLDVEARCASDEHAIDKARRFGSLKYVGLNFPAVIFCHVLCEEPEGAREVGTWEYLLRGSGKPSLAWHSGKWPERPMPDDRETIRHWTEAFSV